MVNMSAIAGATRSSLHQDARHPNRAGMWGVSDRADPYVSWPAELFSEVIVGGRWPLCARVPPDGSLESAESCRAPRSGRHSRGSLASSVAFVRKERPQAVDHLKAA